MRVLLVHNFYLQPGGEDVVFRAESDLLSANGIQVLEYSDHNERIHQSAKTSIALQTIWSWDTYSRIKNIILKQRADVAHFHNTFPLISPSAYYASKELGVPVVQTLHNFRFICPAATLYRAGAVCEKCVNKNFPWPGIRHKCYHDSALHSAVLAASMLTHNSVKTWHRMVDAFIALTEFSKNKFLQAGFPERKLYVKPNFIPDSKLFVIPVQKENFFVYAGRLTPEKGITTVFRAWCKLELPIYVFGNGSMPEIRDTENFHLMSFVERETIFSYMRRAQALIFPSEWYEGFPVTIVEAFACSLPVITANIGSHAEIVKDGYSGLHFRAGDADDLKAKVEWLLQNPREQSRMGRNARKEYEQK